ncbi:MAG: hypothetical protein HON65_11830 [Rhodospirillales bacterium]|jgi:hypothetical protein|nr:hypothetical protein [Rhodospirillales bacterium]
MADISSTPGAIESNNLAVRQAVNQERDVAAIAQKEEEKEPDFEGTGPKDPHRGNIVDIEA